MTTRLDKLKQQQKELNEKIKQAERKEATKQRKMDTRKKIILGGIMLKLVKDGLRTQDDLKRMVDQHVTAERDRALFDLEPLPKTDKDDSGDASNENE